MEKSQVIQEIIERKTYYNIFWDVMNYQLFEINGHGFSVEKVLVGIAFLALGFIISSFLARVLERNILGRMQISEPLRKTMSRVQFYVLLSFTWLFTLHVLNVPITIFAVVGSGVAIGIGFGSQNVVSNFISGLILLIEKPIRLGDFVEVDVHTGTIESIGIRSTVLVSPSNARVVVPNTRILEKSIVNWTLADDYQTASVKLGVAYDSDVKLVERLCRESTNASENILLDRPVSVWLADFGDSSLQFEIGFWVKATTHGQRRAIESQVRYRLIELLLQNKVDLPFSQRDLHIRSSVPLEVISKTSTVS